MSKFKRSKKKAVVSIQYRCGRFLHQKGEIVWLKKKKNVVEELYYGNLNFSIREFKEGSKYARLVEQELEIKKALEILNCPSLDQTEKTVEYVHTGGIVEEIVNAHPNDLVLLNSVSKKLVEYKDKEIDDINRYVDTLKIERLKDVQTLLNNIHYITEIEYSCDDAVFGKNIIEGVDRLNYDSDLEDYINFKQYAEDRKRDFSEIIEDDMRLIYYGNQADMREIFENAQKLVEEQEQVPIQMK